jgi:DNA invertase Pin-like site-specific DNA recombinase
MGAGDHGAVERLAFSYERVSSGQQLQGGGLDRQAGMAAVWCQQHGFTLDTGLDLSDKGRSAFRGEHLRKGALGAFLALAERGELGDQPVLLIEAVDRLSRQEPIDALQQIFFRLVSNGVAIVDLEDGLIYDKASLNGDALIMLVLKCKAAHDYSRRLGRRLAAHWAQAHEGFRTGTRVHRGGNGGVRPHWLTLAPDGAAWELIPERAEIVRQMFDLLQEAGLAVAAKRLNAAGHLTCTGRPWSADSIRRTASDPAVAGRLRINHDASLESDRAHRRWLTAKEAAAAKGQPFRDPEPKRIEVELIPNFYPAVISQELFDATQRLLKERKNDPKSRSNRSTIGHSFLQGMTTCIKGGSMGVTTSAPSGKPMRHYLRCRRRLDGRACDCGGRGWYLPDIHAHVAARLTRHVIDEAALPGADRTAELDQIQGQLKAAEQQLAAARQAVSNATEKMEWAIDNGTPEMVDNLSHSLEKRRSALASAQQSIAALTDERSRIQQRSPLNEISNDEGVAMLQAIGTSTETQSDRQRLNAVLRQAGLQVVLDGRNSSEPIVGMRLGNAADLQWQRLQPAAARAALALGGTGLQATSSRAEFVVPAEQAQALLDDPQGKAAAALIEAIEEQRQQ